MTWAHGITLEAYMPDPSVASFHLGTNTLGGAVGLRPRDPATFNLGSSRLGTGRLAHVPVPYVWVDLTEDATYIETTSGLRIDEPARGPDVGTLAATIKGGPRLIAIGLIPGVKIRVSQGDVTTLWQGIIEDVDETIHLDKRQPRITTISAVDAIADLGTRTRYGSRTGDDVASRLHTIAEQAGYGANVMVDPAAELPVIDTVHETNYADFITMYAVSADCYWHLRHDRGIQYTVLGEQLDPTFISGTPAATPTVVPLTYTDQGSPSYYQAQVTAGTRQVVSQIEATTHGIAGDGSAWDVSSTVSDPTLVATYGIRTRRVDLATPPGSPTTRAVARIFARFPTSAGPTITSLEVDGKTTIIPLWGALRVLFGFEVIERGRTHRLAVAAIAHRITPKRWRTTITPMRRP